MLMYVHKCVEEGMKYEVNSEMDVGESPQVPWSALEVGVGTVWRGRGLENGNGNNLEDK